MMDATMNTTADQTTDSSHNGKANARSYRGGAVLTLVFAALALALAVPRLISALHAVAVQETVTALNAGNIPTAGALVDAVEELAVAARWSGGSDYQLDRGLVLLKQGLATSDPNEQADLLAAAEQATADGLAAGPGEPGAWARLAWLRFQRGNKDGAVAALRLSFLSGAFVPVLMPSRLELALALRSAMDDEMLSLLRRQIRLAWVTSPDFVAKLAERPGVGPLVRNALAELSEQEVARHLELHGPRR
ncbi:hypothetical protein M2352_005283 [Azospirillum fermentarium]|uniref:hypothetical protein n=1 Tax=Azospirillum fermentarium TaxID=1233114 RepID=UPI002227C912|nr:hypothetical protein [Azospirillum fermentarium]MCW2249600.1 hypothetical protein [Azospirillum fermentarium]